MCGIAVIVNFGKEPGVLTNIRGMTDVIRHRGPDDEGYSIFMDTPCRVSYYGGKDTPKACYETALAYGPHETMTGAPDRSAFAAFGHRRLSILDLSPAGHQPMCTADGRFSIVYNGEIYNYIELKEELEKQGVVFASKSDTEVVLYAYAKWGKQCLARFNGMFAFVIIDIQERKIFSARDRYGVKPLYYWYSPGNFLAFASEIKQFTVLPGWEAVLNKKQACAFLVHERADHTDETLFEGVKQLRGGECLESGVESVKNGLPLERWYEPEKQSYAGGFRDAADTFRNLFIDAVRLRLRSDVPIGYSLSGGLDSSSVVCVAGTLTDTMNPKAAQKAFASCSEFRGYDEQEYIEEVVRRTGVEKYFTFPSTEGLFSDFNALVWHQDEPFFSTSIYAEWCVYKIMAENGIVVTLNGHGADELLAGYHIFLYARLMFLMRTLKWRALWNESCAIKRFHGFSMAQQMRHAFADALPESLRSALTNAFGKSQAGVSWLNGDILSLYAENMSGFSREAACSVDALSRAQLYYTSMPVQLHWTDRSSMAHSIESRQPFLDYRLVEFLLSLPEDFKLSGGMTKRVMREAMRGILPERVLSRTDKMGFVTPEAVWAGTHAPEKFRALLKQSIAQSRGILTGEAMRVAEKVISGHHGLTFLLWRLICFGRWMELFSVEVD